MALGGSGGESGSRRCASEQWRCGGALWSVSAGGGGMRRVREGAGAPPLAGPGLIAGQVPPVRRRRRVLGSLAWCCLVVGGGGSPQPSIDLLRRGAAAAVAGGTCQVTVPDEAVPGGPLRCGLCGPADTVLGMGGWPLVVGGVLGRSARRVVLPSHALVLLVHGGLSAGWVGWWSVVVVVVVVVMVVLGALVEVALVAVVMVLQVCPKDSLVSWWGLGVGHSLQPLGRYGLVGSGGGSGAGLNGNQSQGVTRPRVGLAGGNCRLWGVDDEGLGDGDVDEGLDGVVLGGRLCGGGSRLGEGGSGCGGRGVLAWVWVRVWVRAGSLVLPPYVL